MKISKATLKAVLSRLFFDISTNDKGLPVAQPKQFTFVTLQDAASAYKKILEGSKNTTQKVGDESVVFTEYSDKEIEFTPAEVVILKELFDANLDKWTIQDVEAVGELQELFKGKESSP